jgi:broad specificity phosphatase PhoE
MAEKTMKMLHRVALLMAMVGALAPGLSGNLATGQGGVAAKPKLPRHILIIRHAEKTADAGDIHLSKQGQQRAEALHQLFVASKERPEPFPAPDFIFAASNSKNSHRPRETVGPLAAKLKLTIDASYDSKLSAPTDGKAQPADGDGMLRLRDELFGNARYAGKTILVAWRHGTIPELTRALKAAKVPEKWDDNVFDRVWHITYDDQGTATFVDRPQRLQPGDSEK